MMIGISRYVVAASLFGGFAVALGLGAAQSSAHAQTTSSVPTTALNTPAVAKLERAPKVLTGTLFSTHEQRERLDRSRQRGGVPEDEAVVVDVGAKESERSVINGFVKRSDGRDMVWVDDVMKRDPRAEIVEQLEPNVVGGNNSVSTRLLISTPKSSSTIRTQTVAKAVTKARSKKTVEAR
jgi:hypothetical protein